jgi:hypothetical protein
MVMDNKKIDTRFVTRVLKKEWKEFEDIQDRVIRMRTRRVSGTLRNEHRNRKYSVSDGGDRVTASLQHPDYERFLDMKKDRFSTRRVAKVFTDRDRITRKGGRNIHNKIIFGRLNPITYYLMHDLRASVTAGARSRFRT